MRSTLLRYAVLGTLGVLACLRAAWAEELSIPGSGNSEYVLTVLANAFNAQQQRHRVTVPPSSGTAGAVRDVEAGVAKLGRVGRPLKDDELARGLIYLPLGRDPVAFVGGASVTVRSLTAEQLVDVYRGSIGNWRDLGGPDAPIRVIGRESSDASLQAIQRAIKAFQGLAFAGSTKVVHLDPQVVQLLDRFPTSLGFLNQSALRSCKTPVVLLRLNGVAPTAQNVEQGHYPLWLEFGFVYRSRELGGAGKAFVDFTQSPAGRSILQNLGVLVLPATMPR